MHTFVVGNDVFSRTSDDIIIDHRCDPCDGAGLLLLPLLLILAAAEVFFQVISFTGITRANTILGQVSSNGRRTRRRVPPGGATGWMSPLSCRGLSGTQAAVTRRPQRKRGISTRRGVLGQGHRMAALHPGAADFDPGSVQSRWMASSASCTDPTSVLNGLGRQR